MMTPPMAAIRGSINLVRLDNSPTRTSLFNSRPTSRKNMAIKKSSMKSFIENFPGT